MDLINLFLGLLGLGSYMARFYLVFYFCAEIKYSNIVSLKCMGLRKENQQLNPVQSKL